MKTLNKISFIGSLAVGLFVTSSFADVGSNNPTGTSGQFNGNITTGCSYDPYTANATRSITDLAVAGAVGTYPLAFTRTMNSRYTAGLFAEFGQAGNWLHSYSWSIDPAYVTSGAATNTPNSYTVHYPDGRTVIFSGTQTNGPDFRGPLGVRDRFEQITKMTLTKTSATSETGTAEVYLRLPDGGKIWFHVNMSGYWDRATDTSPLQFYATFNFTFSGIIDPYGQMTTITRPSDGSLTITEPAGRLLKIFYTTGPGGDVVVDRVEEWMGNNNGTAQWQGRTVTYHYTHYSGVPYSALTGVSYPDGSSASYTYQTSNNTSSNGSSRLLIKTAVDPMYPGPMWSIGYSFLPYSKYGGVYGQLWGESLSPDGVSVGAVVSQLSVTGTSTRTENRGDGPSRTFTYGSTASGFSMPAAYLLGSVTDFNGVNLYKGYDSSGFVNAIKDGNGNTTTYQNDPWTGNLTLTTYPLTASDRALGLGPATSQTSYTGSGSDSNNPYHVYGYTNAHKRVGRHRRSRKRGFSPTYVRDGSNRVQTINYPDGGTESFTYNNFGQVLTHRLKAGGLETYTYDWRGLLTEYRDAYHLSTADPQHSSVPTNATPTLAYTYYGLDWVKTATDARNNTTSFTYNNRGQLLTTTPPGVAHPITNTYNTNNGTLAAVTNALQKKASFTYDDYKRLIGVYLPPPSGGPTPNPTVSSYDHTGGTASDYSHADANPTRVTLPSGKITKTVYDNNLLKSSVTVAYNTNDTATTTFAYDNNGNVKQVTDPNGNLTQNFYDQQNRLTEVDDPMVNATPPHKNNNGYTVSYTYDQASNKLTTLSANNQLVNYVYDAMNHVTQVAAPQNANLTAITKYTYYTSGLSSGLLYKMQDPHLVAINSNASYIYTYDLMGRKTNFAYPAADSSSSVKNESWTYDTAGNVATFTNRAGNGQTFSYDSRERQTGFTWNDNSTSPQTIQYDDASRVTQIINSDATIINSYFDDNTLKSQKETAADGVDRIVNYTYDPDLNRETIAYPGSHSFSYAYTNRNQVQSIQDTTASNSPVSYSYDADGDVDSETEGGTVTTTATFNAMNLVKHLARGFAGNATRTFDYQYDEMNDRTSIQQDGGTPKTEAYDLAEQATTEMINGAATTFNYDANGNRTGVNGTGAYATNNLNEYTTFNGTAVGYDYNGNLETYNGWSYTYDAQNRMISATNGLTTEFFKYDGLNRQISHSLNAATTYNIWDGWNLIAEFAPGGTTPTSVYVYGARGEIVERMGGPTILYFQDALGNTSHISDATGHLIESYTYSRTGTPTFYNASGGQITASAYAIRHLFHGQLWTQETGLNDYRNRMQLPAMGVFMQADPSGFGGDPTHLYRFCGNNALNASDPLGLDNMYSQNSPNTSNDWLPAVEVTAPEIPTELAAAGVDFGGGGGSGESGESGSPDSMQLQLQKRDNYPGADNTQAVWFGGRVWVSAPAIVPGGAAFALGPGADYLGVGSILGEIGPLGYTAPGLFGSADTKTILDDPNAFTRAVGKEFGGYGLLPFANFMNRFALGASLGVGGIAAFEAEAVPVLLANPQANVNMTQFAQGLAFPGAPPQSPAQAMGAAIREAYMYSLLGGF